MGQLPCQDLDTDSLGPHAELGDEISRHVVAEIRNAQRSLNCREAGLFGHAPARSEIARIGNARVTPPSYTGSSPPPMGPRIFALRLRTNHWTLMNMPM